MKLTARISDVLTRPTWFFDKVKKEKKINNALQYLLVLSVVPAVMGIVMHHALQALFDSNFIYGSYSTFTSGFPALEFFFQFPGTIFLGIFSYGMGIVMTFVAAAILHVWIMLFGGKGDYIKTFQNFVYANTPNYLFNWIPFVGFVTWVWNLVLLILGTKELHKVSGGKAAAIYLIPLAIIIILATLMFIFFFGLIIAAMTQGTLN